MRNAATVLGIIRDPRGLPVNDLYRQLWKTCT